MQKSDIKNVIAKVITWYYRRMLKISWMDKVTNEEVLNRAGTELHFMKNMKRRKMEYAGHVLRGSSGRAHLYILEGKVCGSKARGRPRKTWMDDINNWTRLETYGRIKTTAEDRIRLKTIVVNLLLEDDK